MPDRSYRIEDGKIKDTSFRNCVGIMLLIVITLILITILVLCAFKPYPSTHHDENLKLPNSSGQHGDPGDKTTTRKHDDFYSDDIDDIGKKTTTTIKPITSSSTRTTPSSTSTSTTKIVAPVTPSTTTTTTTNPSPTTVKTTFTTPGYYNTTTSTTSITSGTHPTSTTKIHVDLDHPNTTTTTTSTTTPITPTTTSTSTIKPVLNQTTTTTIAPKLFFGIENDDEKIEKKEISTVGSVVLPKTTETTVSTNTTVKLTTPHVKEEDDDVDSVKTTEFKYLKTTTTEKIFTKKVDGPDYIMPLDDHVVSTTDYDVIPDLEPKDFEDDDVNSTTLLPSTTDKSDIHPDYVEISDLEPKDFEDDDVNSTTLLPSTTDKSDIHPDYVEISDLEPKDFEDDDVNSTTLLPSTTDKSDIHPDYVEISDLEPKDFEDDDVNSTTLLPSTTDKSDIHPDYVEISDLEPKDFEDDEVNSTTLLPTTEEESTRITRDIKLSSVVTTFNNISTTTISSIRTTLNDDDDIVKKDECPVPIPVCLTNSCKRSASKILSLIEHTIDPCDDFYQYSCGAMKTNKISDDSDDDINLIDIDQLFASNSYMRQYKKFYKSCVDYDIDIARNTVGYFLKLLMLNEKKERFNGVNKAADLTELISNLINFYPYGGSSYSTKPLFDVIMDIGPDGVFIPVITLPFSTSPLTDSADGDVYENECRKKTKIFAQNETIAFHIYEFYTKCLEEITPKYVENLSKALNSSTFFDDLPEFNTTQAIARIVTFYELVILNDIGILEPKERVKTLRQKYKDPQYLTMPELEKKYPQIIWSNLFKNIFGDDSSEFTKIQILFPEILDKIFTFYELQSFSEIMESLMALMAHDIYMDFMVPVTCNRELYCTKVVNKLMPEIATKVYLENFDKDDVSYRERIAQYLFRNVRDTMKKSIKRVTWLDEIAINEMKQKFSEIKVLTDRDTIYDNGNVINEKYQAVNITGCFITNIISLKKQQRKLMYETNGQLATNLKYIWTYLTSPLDENPLTITSLNSIILPFRLIAKHIPPLSEKLNQYEDFSRLGYIIASEMAHFFDSTNNNLVHLNKNENYRNFLDIQMAEPQITKYANHFELMFSKNNIIETKDNRFADDAGIRMIYETYQHVKKTFKAVELQLPWIDYNVTQLFYLTFAQQFCVQKPNTGSLTIDLIESEYLPKYFRLNSMIMNDHNFPNIFNCPAGSNMNPSPKMEQFPYLAISDMDYSYEPDISN